MIRKAARELAHGGRSTVHVGSTILGIDKDLFVFVATVGGAGAIVGYALSRSLLVAAGTATLAVVTFPIALVILAGPK